MDNNTPVWLVIAAFRYALGRRTYITSMMSEYLIKNSNLLTKEVKELIINEIDFAIKDNAIGDPCDRYYWEIAKEHIIETLLTGDKNENRK